MAIQMCGIAGIVSKLQKVDTTLIKKMTDSLAHRGPDGEGHWVNKGENLALGHRRLSIVDLSHNAGQPMRVLDDNYVIVFNGEIYNYKELKIELEDKGVTFKSNSDTEVLLYLYIEHKQNCLAKLDGMFAFCIFDKLNNELFCARDRFGEKPFYFFHQNNDFIFASEMKAIFSIGVEKKINYHLLHNYLCDQYAVTDLNDPQKTFFENIEKLPPAHFLKYDLERNSLSIKRYWNLSEKQENINIVEEEAVERFKELFDLSINRRLRSDVPIGSSLSGGLDSSSIVCWIDKLNVKKDIKQKTFSARFKGSNKDEGYFMEKVISKTNVEPYFIWPNIDNLIKNLDEIFYHQEEPFASSSIYAQWEVMKLAKVNNVTVLLDGQGADELFAGYHYYFKSYLKELFLSDKSLYQKELSYYKQLHNPKYKGVPNSKSIRYKISELKNIILQKPKKEKKYLTGEFNIAYGNPNLGKAAINSLNDHLYHDVSAGTSLETLLRYADRNSMSSSREIRLPFLFHELVEFAFSLPNSLKIKNGWTKYIIRKSLEHELPKEIAWRVDKIGYEPPQEQWLQSNVMKDLIHDSAEVLVKERVLDSNVDISSHEEAWTIIMASKLIQ